MKAAVNPPIAFPGLDVGSYSYGLAHEALKSEVYRDRLREIAKSDRYLILDNGADETKIGMSGDPYYDLITDIQPNEIIAPDVLGKAEETREGFEKFWPWFEEYKTQAELNVPKLMAVVQGQNRLEWLKEAYSWVEDDRVDVIGIPYDINFSIEGVRAFPPGERHLSNLWGARRYELVLSVLRKMESLGIEKEVHLLGMSTLYELNNYREKGISEEIRSTDTTAPFAAALDGYVWEKFDSGPKVWKSLSFDVEELPIKSSLKNLVEYFTAVGDIHALMNVKTILDYAGEKDE